MSIAIPPKNIKKMNIPFMILFFSLFSKHAPITPPAMIPKITGHPF